MSQPPPGVNPAHLIHRDRMWTAMLLLLGIGNAFTGIVVTAQAGIDRALFALVMGALCLTYVAVRMFRAHS